MYFDEDYPFTGKEVWTNEKCFNSSNAEVNVTGCSNIEFNSGNDELNWNIATNALRQNGPITAGIFSDAPEFQNYKSGVIINYIECPNRLDHAVLIVGAVFDTNGQYSNKTIGDDDCTQEEQDQ